MTKDDLKVFERRLGIHLGMDGAEILTDSVRMALDAQYSTQPALVTTASGSIPWYLSNYIDPKLIEVLFAPLKAAQILGEAKKGDWTTTTATFPIIESTGEVSSYGDYSNNGSVGVNANFPQRQSYHYQTITQWGEKQLEFNALAKIDYASQLNLASAKVLNRFQNNTYFFGVANLQNYGLLNDPSLSAALAPGTKTASSPYWMVSGAVTATANEIYTDIQSLFTQLVSQSDGLVDMETRMVLAMSPAISVALTTTNQYNVNVHDLIKKNFPNIRIETAMQYGSSYNGGTAGNLVQLIAEEIEGQQTGTCAFTEKMRAHPIIRDISSFKQKKSQGSWGAIIWQPFAIASMVGV